MSIIGTIKSASGEHEMVVAVDPDDKIVIETSSPCVPLDESKAMLLIGILNAALGVLRQREKEREGIT